MTKSILLLAAHPDDEVLGAGGTLACWTAEGAEVVVVFLADGVGARGEGNARPDGAGVVERRRAKIRRDFFCGAVHVFAQAFATARGDQPHLAKFYQAFQRQLGRSSLSLSQYSSVDLVPDRSIYEKQKFHD